MRSDRYAPPASEVASVAPVGGKRPISVLLLLIVSYGAAIVLVVGLVRRGLSLASGLEFQGSLLVPVVMSALALLFVLSLIVAIHRKSAAARYLGAALVVLLSLAVFIGGRAPSDPSSAYAFGWHLGRGIVLVPLLYWVYAFGWSSKARAYFRVGQR